MSHSHSQSSEHTTRIFRTRYQRRPGRHLHSTVTIFRTRNQTRSIQTSQERGFVCLFPLSCSGLCAGGNGATTQGRHYALLTLREGFFSVTVTDHYHNNPRFRDLHDYFSDVIEIIHPLTVSFPDGRVLRLAPRVGRNAPLADERPRCQSVCGE